LLDAIGAGDTNAATALMDRHLHGTVVTLRRLPGEADDGASSAG
jgi:hypothetical protein